MSRYEEVQLTILDVLLEEGGHWDAGDGVVLVSLAQRAFDDDSIKVGSAEYKMTSIAVLSLEEMGFIEVHRRFEPKPGKANIIEGIYLV